MDSFILGVEEMEYWDTYNEQRERQGDFLERATNCGRSVSPLCQCLCSSYRWGISLNAPQSKKRNSS